MKFEHSQRETCAIFCIIYSRWKWFRIVPRPTNKAHLISLRAIMGPSTWSPKYQNLFILLSLYHNMHRSNEALVMHKQRKVREEGIRDKWRTREERRLQRKVREEGIRDKWRAREEHALQRKVWEEGTWQESTRGVRNGLRSKGKTGGHWKRRVSDGVYMWNCEISVYVFFPWVSRVFFFLQSWYINYVNTWLMFECTISKANLCCNKWITDVSKVIFYLCIE